MTDLNKVNFMSKARFDNLSVTNDDELYLVETNIAVDEEVVHKTGVETISGNKTFSNNIVVTGTTTLNNALTVNGNATISSTTTFGSNVKVSGVIHIPNNVNSNSSYSNGYIELMPSTTSTNGGYIDFHYAGSSDDYTARLIESANGDITYVGSQRDTASNSTTLGTLAVKGWVNDPAKSTNVVHRSGNETISGNKVFNNTVTANAGVRMEGINTASGAESLRDVVGIDTNNARVGGLRFMHSTDNTRRAILYICKTDNTYVNGLTIGLSDDDTTVFTSVPTPPVTDNSTQIATTAWVNTRLGGTGITSTEIGYLNGVTSNIQTQLNGKQASGSYANTSASNFNATGKSTVVGWGMPDYNTAVTIPTSDTEAPYNCWVEVGVTSAYKTAKLYINGREISVGQGRDDSHDSWYTCYVPKGTTIYQSGSFQRAVYYKLKGES